MLAIDPYLGGDHAARRSAGGRGDADSGDAPPLRGAQDLVLGMTVALSDGDGRQIGRKVIKNVPGYDLGKLFTRVIRHARLILSVAPLHPLPPQTVRCWATGGDPERWPPRASLAAAPLELEALDVAWRGDRGGVLAQCGAPPVLAGPSASPS